MLGLLPSLLACDRAVNADTRSALLGVPGTVINKIHPAPLWRDLAAEALQLSVPDDDVALPGRDGLNGALGELAGRGRSP